MLGRAARSPNLSAVLEGIKRTRLSKEEISGVLSAAIVRARRLDHREANAAANALVRVATPSSSPETAGNVISAAFNMQRSSLSIHKSSLTSVVATLLEHDVTPVDAWNWGARIISNGNVLNERVVRTLSSIIENEKLDTSTSLDALKALASSPIVDQRVFRSRCCDILDNDSLSAAERSSILLLLNDKVSDLDDARVWKHIIDQISSGDRSEVTLAMARRILAGPYRPYITNSDFLQVTHAVLDSPTNPEDKVKKLHEWLSTGYLLDSDTALRVAEFLMETRPDDAAIWTLLVDRHRISLASAFSNLGLSMLFRGEGPASTAEMILRIVVENVGLVDLERIFSQLRAIRPPDDALLIHICHIIANQARYTSSEQISSLLAGEVLDTLLNVAGSKNIDGNDISLIQSIIQLAEFIPADEIPSSKVLDVLNRAYQSPNVNSEFRHLCTLGIDRVAPLCAAAHSSTWWNAIADAGKASGFDGGKSAFHSMPVSFLRNAEFSALCLDSAKAQAPADIDMDQTRSVYLAARSMMHHPYLHQPRLPDALVHTVFQSMRAFGAVEHSNTDDFLQWFASNEVLAWRGKSSHLHVVGTAALSLGTIAFGEPVIARGFAEFVRKNVLDSAVLKAAQLSTPIEDEVIKHGLFVIERACLCLQNEAADSENPSKSGDGLLEWFSSDTRSGLMGAILRTIEQADDISTVRLGLGCIRSSMLIDLIDKDTLQKHFYDSLRRRLSSSLMKTFSRFSIEQGSLSAIAGPVMPLTSYFAAEPNQMWSEEGTAQCSRVALYLRRLEKSKMLQNDETLHEGFESSATAMERAMFSDLKITADSIPKRPSSPLKSLFGPKSTMSESSWNQSATSNPAALQMTAVDWILHTGFVCAPYFRNPAIGHSGRKAVPTASKDGLTPVARRNLGDALLHFERLSCLEPRQRHGALNNALGSFLGRKNAPWTPTDTKLALRVLQSVKREGLTPNLSVMCELSKRTALSKMPRTPKLESLRDKTIDMVFNELTTFSSVLIEHKMESILLSMRILANLLENANNVSELQVQVYNKGLADIGVSYINHALAFNNPQLLEMTCLALQNMVAFQPLVARPLYEDSVSPTKRPRSVVNWLFKAMSSKEMMMRETKAATAVLGAYFALIQADPKASIVCSVNVPRISQWIAWLKTLHMDDTTYQETVSELAKFIKKQPVQHLGVPLR